MTPAIEAAQAAGVDLTIHEYEGVDPGEPDYAVAVAAALGIEPARLFKTLLASVGGKLQVFVVPADRQLDLRSAGKRARMADRTQAERATGYVAGGISPPGQRRPLAATGDQTAPDPPTIPLRPGPPRLP